MPYARRTVNEPAMPPVAVRRDLLCRTTGTDPDLWYSDADRDRQRAKHICARCPAQLACLRHALDNDLSWGVWGGYDPAERRAIAKAEDERRNPVPDLPTPPAAGPYPWAWPGRNRQRHYTRLFAAVEDMQPGEPIRVAAKRLGIKSTHMWEAALIARWAPDLVGQVRDGWVHVDAAVRYAGQVRDVRRLEQNRARVAA